MTGRVFRAILLVFLLPPLLFAGADRGFSGERGFPDVFVAEAPRYPDLTQTDLRARLPLGGWFHCGPVAVSNALVWFRDRGIRFADSFPRGGSPEDQIEVARTLGGRRYMDTRFVNGGTTVHDFVTGLERYLADHALDPFSIRYTGWGSLPDRFATGRRVPDMESLCRAFSGGSAVFINLGWYRSKGSEDVFYRNGGHWVTLVGYRWPAKDPFPELLVHDPAPWSGKEPRTHRVRLAGAGRSRFALRSGGIIGSTEPYARVAGGLAFKGGTDLALIEGAVVLTPEVRAAVPWKEDRTGVTDHD